MLQDWWVVGLGWLGGITVPAALRTLGLDRGQYLTLGYGLGLL